jgi:2,5-dihydroxypyridine 5,6-dioxygenase
MSAMSDAAKVARNSPGGFVGDATAPIDAWQNTLSQCNVLPGEKVIVLVDKRSRAENAKSAFNAAAALGAHVVQLEIPPPPTDTRVAWSYLAPYHAPSLSTNRMAIDAMKSADMVIDLVGIDRCTEQHEILEAGTRVLLVREPSSVLRRLPPNQDTKMRIRAAADRMESAKVMRVTSDAGTEFSVELGEYPLLVQYALADEPGRWDHWPSGFVASWPNEGTAKGTVVLDAGDIILPFKEYIRTAIHLTIEDGYIVSIDGGFDADYLRDYMAMFDDREGYAIAHLGWGLLKGAQWSALGMFDKAETAGMEARSFPGNFMFSTGPNGEVGGERKPYCHLDIPMRHCSVYLDNELVVENGQALDD